MKEESINIMSKSIYDVLRQLHESGATLEDLLNALNEQLELIRNSEPYRKVYKEGRLVSLSQSNLEVALMYAEKYKQIKGEGIPLILEED
jgi:hypothetical protein